MALVCSGSRLIKAWARLISLYSWNFGDGRMEALGYLGKVEGVLRSKGRKECVERVPTACLAKG